MANQNPNPESFGKAQQQSFSLLARVTSDETLAGGAAKSKELDKRVLDSWIDAVGMAEVRKYGVNALEADWIATSNALFYVTPNADSVISYPWSLIGDIIVGRRRAMSSELVITTKTDERPIKLKAGRTSCDRLLELWKTYGQNPGKAATRTSGD